MNLSPNVTESVSLFFIELKSNFLLTKINEITGVVRSIEYESDTIYLLPSVSAKELHCVNVLALCNVPLPSSLLLNHSSRILSRIPYVYSDGVVVNNFGLAKIVPNLNRPERRMSNNSNKS